MTIAVSSAIINIKKQQPSPFGKVQGCPIKKAELKHFIYSDAFMKNSSAKREKNVL